MPAPTPQSSAHAHDFSSLRARSTVSGTGFRVFSEHLANRTAELHRVGPCAREGASTHRRPRSELLPAATPPVLSRTESVGARKTNRARSLLGGGRGKWMVGGSARGLGEFNRKRRETWGLRSCTALSLGPRSWTLDPGPWTLDPGPLTLDPRTSNQTFRLGPLLLSPQPKHPSASDLVVLILDGPGEQGVGQLVFGCPVVR
eukprot:909291-Rhodomonas_salina.5